MKKLVSILLVLFIGFAVVGIADEKIDLKSFTDDEILDLRQNINEEIKNRNIEDVDMDYDEADSIENGEYLCDRDFPEGRYTLKIIQADSWCNFSIKEGDNIIFDQLVGHDGDGFTYTFSIKKNQKIILYNAAVAILKKSSEKNWMKK